MTQNTIAMVDIKFAVKKAKEYLADFFPEEIDTIRLEETELNEEGDIWKVTLSFLQKKDPVSTVKMSPMATGMAATGFAGMFEGSVPSEYRVYKSLKVRKSDGEVLGMTIWKA